MRDQRISFRLTRQEALALRERAARASQSLCDYARAAALAVAPRGRPNGHPPFNMEPASFHQIRRLGVNLNQIARRLNAQDLPAPPELPSLIADIQTALKKALPP